MFNFFFNFLSKLFVFLNFKIPISLVFGLFEFVTSLNFFLNILGFNCMDNRQTL
jgi:hypothetical protein